GQAAVGTRMSRRPGCSAIVSRPSALPTALEQRNRPTARALPMDHDFLLLGGGPAGATAAFLLARAGWKVLVVEKAKFPRRKVCGEFISAGTLSLFDKLGFVGDLRGGWGAGHRRV